MRAHHGQDLHSPPRRHATRGLLVACNLRSGAAGIAFENAKEDGEDPVGIQSGIGRRA